MTETDITLIEKYSMELAETEAEAREYQRTRDELNEKTSYLARERNELNNKASELFQEIRRVKNRDHDISNELARMRFEKEANFEELAQIREELKPLQEDFEKMKGDPGIPYHSLRREQRDLEWKLQTTVMKMEEERNYVERIAEIQRKLKPEEERENLRSEIRKKRKHARALRARIDFIKPRIPELVAESRALREKLTEPIEKANEIRKAADEKHAEFLEAKEQADTMHQKFIEKLKLVKACRGQLSGVKGALKKKRSAATRKLIDQTAESAFEKWKTGEKLTIDEFKLLVQKGLL